MVTTVVRGSVVDIRSRPKRFRCPPCAEYPTTTQRLSWYAPSAFPTTVDEQYLLMPLGHRTIEDVCQQAATSADVVLGTIERGLTPDIAWEALRCLGLTRWPSTRALGTPWS
jgi:hypothetical protein